MGLEKLASGDIRRIELTGRMKLEVVVQVSVAQIALDR